MSEAIIFAMGCFVTLIVGAAVGLLLWSAANEPRGNLVQGRVTGKPESVPPSSRSATVPAQGVEL